MLAVVPAVLVDQLVPAVAAQIVEVDLQVVAVHFAQTAFVIVAVVGLTLDNLLQWTEIRSFLVVVICVVVIFHAIAERNKRTSFEMDKAWAFAAIADFLEFEHVNIHQIHPIITTMIETSRLCPDKMSFSDVKHMYGFMPLILNGFKPNSKIAGLNLGT